MAYQSPDEAYFYKLNRKKKSVVFLVLYIDDILLMLYNVKLLIEIKNMLAIQLKMKDFRNTNYVLGIQIFSDRKNKTLALSQATYIDKVLARFLMQNSKNGLMPTRYELSYQCPTKP